MTHLCIVRDPRWIETPPRKKTGGRRITAARIEDFNFLLSVGEEPVRAARRAGWPTLDAAEVALRRAGHPCARDLQRAQWEARQHRKAAA